MDYIDYQLDLISVRSGFDGKSFFAQARAGAIPGLGQAAPTVVLTAQPALRSGSDVFFALSEWRTSDYGKNWEGPVEHHESLGRRSESAGVEVAICDMTPGWHATTGKLLSTGHTVRYLDDQHPITARTRETAYAVYEADHHSWRPWQVLAMPNEPAFQSAGAGSAQRVDLEDGTILLPIYHKPVSGNWHACHAATVIRCEFDGDQLTYLEHGNTMTTAEPRGFCEPSITTFQGRYYLTLRNDLRGYVAAGEDGLHFSSPQPWHFDDGTELGSYNTQQHWITHDQGLFLVYTRRGLDNDHVFRHRAPLMMAQVDPEKLVVLRQTERQLIPNRGARLGNFAVCRVGADQTWVVAAEWMQPVGCEKYGSDNTIWAVRIIWKPL